MRLHAVVLICLAAATCGAVGKAAAADIRVGVINVREVFARYRKAEDLRKKNEKKLRPRQQELERRQRELLRRAADIREKAASSGRPEGPTDRAEGEEEEARQLREMKKLELEDYVLKLDRRQFTRDVQAANERLMLRLWEELAEACRRVAEADGYDLVLKFYGPDPAAATARESLEAFRGDAILHMAPSIDITSRVLKVLENAYRRGIKLIPEDRDGEADAPPEGGHG